jgi:hypothetical protein
MLVKSGAFTVVLCVQANVIWPKLDTVYSGKQPLKIYYKIQCFGDQLNSHHQVDVKLHLPYDGDGVGLRNAGFYNIY